MPQVFIDNRGGRLTYHVRQMVNFELDAYVRTPAVSLDRDNVTFRWSVGPSTAAVEEDVTTPGRGFSESGNTSAALRCYGVCLVRLHSRRRDQEDIVRVRRPVAIEIEFNYIFIR